MKVVEPVSTPHLIILVMMVLIYGTLVLMLRAIFGIDNRRAS